jgi:hypothetical protein
VDNNEEGACGEMYFSDALRIARSCAAKMYDLLPRRGGLAGLGLIGRHVGRRTIVQADPPRFRISTLNMCAKRPECPSAAHAGACARVYIRHVAFEVRVMKTTSAIAVAFALSVFAIAASAQTVTVHDDAAKDTAAPAEATQTDAAATEPAKPQIASTCLTLTGSRVTAHRNLRAVREGRPERECANGTGRVYSDDQIERTGQRSIADALRTLDTGIR